ncbi:MAG: sensor histidine kinase [bacterium]|nr:sensor histidine kinase [bacterium]
MKLEDKSSRKEQKGINEILDCIIKEYVEEYSLDLEIEKHGEINNWKETSESFLVQNDSKEDHKQTMGHQRVSREDAITRVNAIRQAQQMIEQNKRNQQLYTCEKYEKVRYSILDVLELDRKRISRDLHDSTVQILTMLVHKAELCEKLIEIDTIRTKMELQVMSNVLKDSISELRQTIFNLRPMSMDDLGLMDSIERYLQILIQSSEVAFLIDVNDEDKLDIEQLLTPVQKLSLYRILQECCSNILKHSNANKALITLQVKRDEIVLMVEDNGKGFNNPVVVNKINEINNDSTLEHDQYFQELSKEVAERTDFSGYGLSMLQERVYLLDGRLQINSQEDGCRITVSIPVITKEEDLDETD